MTMAPIGHQQVKHPSRVSPPEDLDRREEQHQTECRTGVALGETVGRTSESCLDVAGDIGSM